MPKKPELTYEEAREQLSAIATQLERGNISLEESLALWEQGEKLATICDEWLTNARNAVTGTPTEE